MRTASFFHKGEPVAKARPRAEIRYKDGKPYPHIYTPDTTTQHETDLGWAFKANNPGWEPLTGKVSISIAFRTTNHKTDWDNLAKTVCDALNHIAWNDDRQIYDVTIFVNRVDDDPQTYVWIQADE